ncbi:MAG: hypothetical protein HYS33_02480, partial [Acidobacteria bacterium]|nr:hypothetical protein [Acidobacteriota bacterium]
DAKRERTVGAPAIERQYQMFEQARAAISQEGFDQIVTLADEHLERVEIEIVFRPVAKQPPAAPRPEERRPAPRRESVVGNQPGQARYRRWSGRERGPYVPPRSGPSMSRPTAPPPMPNGAPPPAPSAAPAAESPEPDKAPDSTSGSQETGGGT